MSEYQAKVNIEYQVVNLLEAKHLKLLGVEQNSIFDWVRRNETEEFFLWLMSPYNRQHLKNWHEQYSAFTSSELGVLLPSYLMPESDSKKESRLEFCKNKKNEWCISYAPNDHPPKIVFISNNEASARAQMIIFLIQNGLIK